MALTLQERAERIHALHLRVQKLFTDVELLDKAYLGVEEKTEDKPVVDEIKDVVTTLPNDLDDINSLIQDVDFDAILADIATPGLE